MSSKMYGRDSTPDKVRKHIVELKTGNKESGIAPLSVTNIAKKLGLSRETIYQYLKKSKELGEVKTNDEGKIEVNKELAEAENWKQFNDSHPITQDPIVKSWISSSRTMGHGGNGVRAMKAHIHGIQKVCNYLKISPIQLTIDFKTSEQYAQSYFDALAEGKIPRTSNKAKSSVNGAFYQIRMAIRHLMQYNTRNAISIPRGYNGILSGRIIGHGNYADVDMTDDEIAQAEKYIIEKYGIDSDIYRIFFVGLESCARKEALLDMTLELTKDVDEDGEVTYFMTAHESKTAHIADGKWDKFIQRKKTQESIDKAKAKGYERLWNNKEKTKWQAYDELLFQLKDIYHHVGKTNHYFYEHAFHTLRHIGAHYWLRKTDYNYGFVANIGGWTVIDELKKSYGKMPPNITLKLMKKSRGNLNEL